MVLKNFRELILATWTTEEILAVQDLTKYDAMPPRVPTSTLEGMQILHPARRGRK
jgi:hypothetical protein